MNNIESRNIVDFYHYWKTEAIKADLDKRRHPFSILCCNFAGDFNLAGCIRSANAFLASHIYIVGKNKYDKRGTVGTHHYEHIKHVDIDDLDHLRETYNIVAVDNIDGATPIETFEWPDWPLLVFGEEQVGIPPEIREKCDYFVYIKQYGSVRSLNVASAGSIAMYDWCSKNVSLD